MITDNASNQVTAREDALYAAMRALDHAALNDILSDDLSYVHSNGVAETKDQYLAALRRGLYEYGAVRRTGGGTRLFDGVAVTSGAIEMVVGAEGSAKKTIRLLDVLVWTKEDEIWRLLLRQATRIP